MFLMTQLHLTCIKGGNTFQNSLSAVKFSATLLEMKSNRDALNAAEAAAAHTRRTLFTLWLERELNGVAILLRSEVA